MTQSGAPPEVSVVIPIHNEELVLGRAIGDIRQALQAWGRSFEIVLAENGSTDATPALAQKLAESCSDVHVITLGEANYGRALRLGMEAARGRVIANFDIDYWDVPFLRDAYALLEYRFDIVIGSKNLLLSTDERTWLRRIVSQGFRFLLRLGFRLRVSDTHGIKAWKSSELLRRLMSKVRYDHHLFDTELIIRGQRAGLGIVELPVEVSETRRARGILRRIPRALSDLAGLRLLLWREGGGARG